MDLVKEIKYKRFKPEERFFLEIIDGLKIKEQNKYNQQVFWMKNGEVLFQQDFEMCWLRVKHDNIWKVFELKFKLNTQEITKLISDMTEQYLNWKGMTPHPAFSNRCDWWDKI